MSAAKSELWALYNPLTEQNLKGLSLIELQIAVAVIRSEDRPNWLVFREGWSEWRMLSRVPELLSWQNRTMHTPEFEAETTDLIALEIKRVFVEPVTHTNSQVTAPDDPEPDVEVEKNNEFVHRLHQRLSRRFVVAIAQNQQTFKTTTLNISEGGVLLADPLPDWAVGYVRLSLTHPESQQTIDLTCSVVENQNPKRRQRLEITEPGDLETKKIFASWLAA